jgi:solute carrier family 25 iron transporter 28/37
MLHMQSQSSYKSFLLFSYAAHAAYFSIFEASKRLVGKENTSHQPTRAAFCGISAALSHDLIMTPFDVVKQRMQLGYYRSLLHCLMQIIRQDSFRALYVSFPTTLMMNIPYGSIMVPVNESMKRVLNPSGSFSYQVSMLSGAVAGAVAAALTNPLDVLKTRLQTQNLAPSVHVGGAECVYYQAQAVRALKSTAGELAKPSIPHAAISTSARPIEGVRMIIRRIVAEEGYRAFTRGIVPRVLTQSPAVAISWTTYETLKSMLER